jgi:hypothetical protein
VTETTDVSAETLGLMSKAAAVNCGLAAVGVAIACYAYFNFSHPLNVRYDSRSGIVLQSVELYISVFPVFQVFIFAISALPAWSGSFRRHIIQQNLELRNNLRPSPRPVTPDYWEAVHKLLYFWLGSFEVFGLVGTAYRSVLIAIQAV